MIPELPILQTKRLTLQVFEETDAMVFLNYGATLPSVESDWEDNRNREERVLTFMTYLANSMSFERESVSLVWSIRTKRDAATIGALAFSRISESSGALDCIMLDPEKSSGLAVEAVRELVSWAYGALPKLATIFWDCWADDASILDIPSRCGMGVCDEYLAVPPGAGKAPRKVVVWSMTRTAGLGTYGE